LTIVQIDEAAVVAQPDVLDVDQCCIEACLPRGVLVIGQRTGILGIFGRSHQMKVASGADFFPRVDQALMDRIELVGMSGNDLPLDRLLEPGPLKHRRLENRSRCIRVIFQQFGRAASVITEVEPAVETALVVVPARGDQWPECFRYLQSAQ
jgi:hypothetical protein